MRKLRIGKYKEKYYTPGKSIKESDKESRILALESSKKHTDQKPIKYLLKR